MFKLFTSFQCFNSPAGDESLLKFWGYYNNKVPQWQRMLLKATFSLLRTRLGIVLNITPEGAKDGLAKSKSFFDEVDKLLGDGRKFLLNTDEPTYVDVAFASLGAILLIPDNYGGIDTFDGEVRPTECDLSTDYKKERLEFAKRPSGKFVTMMYKEHRH